jgi:hypothetical protein
MENPLINVKEIIQICPETLAEVFTDYYNKKYSLINEKVESSRYAVEINYKTTMQEVDFGFAKIALGYVSAALKKMGYHVKLVFTESPLRIIISSRNWDDGEWVGMISYNSTLGCFVLSKGHYNRIKKTVNVIQSTRIEGDVSASDLTKKLKEKMDDLKDLKAHKRQDIVINLKRGPKS